jgi:hypothetical protein
VTTVTAVARDVKPPAVLVRVMNPVLRLLLRTPFGRAVGPFALLELTARRSGRRLLVPVGWHETADGPVVFTPATWRANFAGGHPVTVHHRGRRRELTGTLVTDPTQVAAAMQSFLGRHGSLRHIGVDAPAGHRVTVADVRAVDRALLTFRERTPAVAGG